MSATDPINQTLAEHQEEGTLSGKYLTFRLGEEEFGVEILKVREIIGLMDITVVPRTPHCMRGVINLRGKIIPVVDLRLKFLMPSIEDTEQSCIIVVDTSTADGQPAQMGILVDTVSEVLDIAAEQIEPTPAFGNGVNTKFIRGMARVEENVKILLSIDEVLNHIDLSGVDQAESDTPAAAAAETASQPKPDSDPIAA
ncbi:MAG: chemotaxis protein CheW [Phycisphaeraceae bacterium]|nr:chemotaxis protein CheW [Phycisphaeraceae bacterium]